MTESADDKELEKEIFILKNLMLSIKLKLSDSDINDRMMNIIVRDICINYLKDISEICKIDFLESLEIFTKSIKLNHHYDVEKIKQEKTIGRDKKLYDYISYESRIYDKIKQQEQVK